VVREILSEGAHTTRLHTDLDYFAEHSLKIRFKAGPLEPFRLNAAQRKLHQIIDDQKAKTGRARVIVLKARQLGVSTYVAARLYHKTINSPGLRIIIVGHERAASRNLFEIVKRFHENMPDDLRPHTGTSNAEELIFDRIDSGYLVSVATNEGAGRSATAQLLHASEAAFWADLPAQMASLMQVVPDLDGTEIIVESTANGYNDFHQLWRKAEAGESEFLPVFLPWSIDPEYRRAVDSSFVPDADERQLMELHGLAPEQIAWRRAKISQLGSSDYFCQEYPITASEAFISSTFDSFIPTALVIKARQEKVEPYGPLIIGVDPASVGADRTSIAWRRGHSITKVESRRGLDLMEVTGWVGKIIREEKPAKVNVDVGGLGIGVFDRLMELGHSRSVVNAVNFGGKPIEPPPLDEQGQPAGGPANRRAELWSNLKAALEQGRFALPDRDSLQADLVSCGYRYRSDGKLILESKEDMRKRGMVSPDEADAVVLCFSEPAGSAFPHSKNFHRDLSQQYKGLYI
jgi:hypothetical protein